MSKGKPKSTSRRIVAKFERQLKKVRHERYVLRLYITGITPKSTRAVSNIRSLCEEYLAGRYDLEVIDIYQHPGSVMESQIIAAPTLIKEYPEPIRRMIGDLTDRGRMLVVLDIKKDDAGKTNPDRPVKWIKP